MEYAAAQRKQSKAESNKSAALRIGSPSDAFEQEADRVANSVVGSAGPSPTWSLLPAANPRLQRCGCGGSAKGGGECDECKKKKELQRAATGAAESAFAPPVVHQVLDTPGEPLSQSTRSFFEPRLGFDLRGVRIHADAKAAESARSVQARAFTAGRHLVFNEGQYNPTSQAGRKLLAHELTHTAQQSAGETVRRAPGDTYDVDLVGIDPEEAERLKKQGIDLPKVSPDTFKTLKRAPPSPPLTPAQAPSGFTSAAAGAAPCPDAPQATTIPASCAVPASVAGSAPPAKETATLPALDESAFGGDANVESFATGLADCHAARIVDAEVNKRYNKAVDAAKKTATAEAKADTDKAIADAAAGVDPKDKKAIADAKKQATSTAKAAAAKKIADAQSAVQKENTDTVKAALSATFKDELKADYLDTMHAALNRYGSGWVATMIAAQNREKIRLTKEKNAKPKVGKGETPPPARPAEEISAEIEAEMTAVRCRQQNWAANQIEKLKRGWMVGRREKVDFDTIAQKVTELKDFKPGRTVAEADRAQIPDALKSDKTMPGVAPEVVEFLTSLQALDPNFKAGNYSGHGGGEWAGAGFSIDLTLSGKDSELDERGFYKHDAAVKFLLNLNQVVVAMQGKWRVLYNDFGVAEEVNHSTGTRNVTYTANNPKGTLNWHGPLVLHFHLDIQLPPPAPPTPAATQNPTP